MRRELVLLDGPAVAPPAPGSVLLALAVFDASAHATAGTVYLLHLDRPYVHAAHYTGWTRNLADRLDAHAAGRGARLLAVVTAAGIGWQLARTWPGDRNRERALKRQGGASRRCPMCGVRPRDVDPVDVDQCGEARP